MTDLTVKLYGSQALTVRKALGFYWTTLDKLAKKEDDSGVSSEHTRKLMSELEELIRVVTPPDDQNDFFTPPPESYESPELPDVE